MRKLTILLNRHEAASLRIPIPCVYNEPASRVAKRLSPESSDAFKEFSQQYDTKTVRYRQVPDTIHKGKLSLSQQRLFTYATFPLVLRHYSKSNTLLAPMLTRTVSSLLTVTQRLFFGTSSQGRGESNMDTSEKLIYSKGIKQLEIRACGRLYSELAKSRPILFSGVPKDSGILFKVDYYDSIDLIKSNSNEAPVVCILHGSPGHYQEFSSLINFLTNRGVRVLAPNFPDYNVTYQHGFRHSARERLDFLLEFLKALNVTRLDLLIGHSGSVYTMFELLDHSLSDDISKWSTTSQDFRVQVKSLGLLSTPSHKLSTNMAVTPLRLLSLKLFDYNLLRPFMLAFIDWWVRVQGIKNRVDKNKIENLLIAASTIGYSDHDKMGSRLDLLKRNKIPVLLVYGTKDRLIDLSTFEQLQRDLGAIDETRVKVYRNDGTLERGRVALDGKSDQQQLIDVSRFNDGGHYVFQRHPNQVNEDVHDFLRHRVLNDRTVLQQTRL